MQDISNQSLLLTHKYCLAEQTMIIIYIKKGFIELGVFCYSAFYYRFMNA